MQGNGQDKRRLGRRTAVRAVGGAALGGVALGALGATGAAHADADQAPVIGSWLLTAQARNRQAFHALMCFFPGGIIQYIDSPQTPSQRADDPPEVLEHQSVGCGQWIRTGFNEYAFTATGIDYDGRGNATGLDTVKGTVTYDPVKDQWSGAISLTEVDLAGAVRASFSYAPTATRIAVTA